MGGLPPYCSSWAHRAAYYLFLHEMGRGRVAGVDFNELLAASLSIVTLLECAALAVVAIRAAGSITAEKERDSWLTLVSTALTPQEIIRAKVAGSIYAALVRAADRHLVAVARDRDAGLLDHSANAGIFVPVRCLGGGDDRRMVFVLVHDVDSGHGRHDGTMRISRRRIPAVLHSVFPGERPEGIFALAACIPFLLVMPTVLWMEGIQSNVSNADVNTTFAFLLGLSGYLVLGVAMMHANINQFDRRVGRPMRVEPFSAPPPPPPASPASNSPVGDRPTM